MVRHKNHNNNFCGSSSPLGAHSYQNITQIGNGLYIHFQEKFVGSHALSTGYL